MDDLKDVDLLETSRWGEKVSCPYCLATRITRRKNQRFHCNSCFVSFGVLTGTFFGNSKMALHQWFAALQIVVDSREEVSGRELGRRLGVNRMTGCRTNRQIREAMRREESRLLIQRILLALDKRNQ